MATKMVWQHEVFFCDAYALGGKRDLQVQEKVLGLGKELNVDPVYSRTQIRMPQWLLSLLIPVALLDSDALRQITRAAAPRSKGKPLFHA